MVRQVSALNIICKLDRLDCEWGDQETDIMKLSNGINAIVSFLEQNHQQGYKAQACQILGMILEHGSMNEEIERLKVQSILEDLTTHGNTIVQQNAKEALILLNGDDEEGSESDQS